MALTCITLVATFSVIWGQSVFLPDFDKILDKRRVPVIADKLLDHSEFGSVQNLQTDANLVKPSSYPWMALMYRSRGKMRPSTSLADHPYCSAICVQKRIFITSAKCVYNQRVDFVWIYMNMEVFYAQAFVMPNVFSKQAFDDIGFVVVKNNTYSEWKTANIYSKNKRNDHNYAWFAKSDINNPKGRYYKAIGYAQKMLALSSSIYLLYELDVVIDINSCVEFHTKRHRKDKKHYDGYHVPCYYYCTLTEWKKNVSACWSTLSPHGGAVYNPKTKEVVGVVTWASLPQFGQPPVGFAVPNTNTFHADYKCAQRIRDDKKENVPAKYYQKLCDKK